MTLQNVMGVCSMVCSVGAIVSVAGAESLRRARAGLSDTYDDMVTAAHWLETESAARFGAPFFAGFAWLFLWAGWFVA